MPGLIAPYQSVAIQSDLTEPADRVNVQEGDHVTTGEVLAVLDTADLVASLNADLATAQSDTANATHTVYQGGLTIEQSRESVRSASSGVKQAQETLRKDSLDLARYQQLLGNGFVSQQQVATQLALVNNDRQAVRGAQSTLSSTQEQVTANGTLSSGGLQSSSVQQAQATTQVALATAQQVRTQIAKATISSPIDGVVVNRNLNVGEYPGTRQIFTLQQTDPSYAIVRGSGAQIADIEPGAKAKIVASDLRNGTMTGTVVAVLNQINPGSTDFQVKVRVDNPGGRLRSGMSVVGRVSTPEDARHHHSGNFVHRRQSRFGARRRQRRYRVDGARRRNDHGRKERDRARYRERHSRRLRRSDERGRRSESGRAVNLTRLFVSRPTLVFVLVALMLFAGVLSTLTIVKQLFPNVDQPTVSISVTYNGASVTEMRDNIVAPIEQNLAGTQDLQTFSSTIQQGQATIAATFTLTSDEATDLALTQKALQAAETRTADQPDAADRRHPRSFRVDDRHARDLLAQTLRGPALALYR